MIETDMTMKRSIFDWTTLSLNCRRRNGGSFDSSAGALRITNRTWLNPKNRVFSKVASYGGSVDELYNFIGFRCAKSLNPPAEAPAPADSPPTGKPAQG